MKIKLNENQINNINYDVQFCNDDEISNSKKINDDKDFSSFSFYLYI